MSDKSPEIMPEDITLNRVLSPAHGPDQATIYLGIYNGKPVVIKNYPNAYSGYGLPEDMALATLQGLPCVPKFYGKLNTPYLKHVPDQTKPWLRETMSLGGVISIVEEVASGRSLTDREPKHLRANSFQEDYLLAAHHQKTGRNLRADVSSRIASYVKGALDRGLIDQDLQANDIFLDVNSDGTLKVTKVDYEDMYDPQGRFRKATGQILSLVPELGVDYRWDSMDSTQTGVLKDRAARLKGEGLVKLGDLLDSYIGDQFRDTAAFLQFLAGWEGAMEEHGRYLIERGEKPLQKRLREWNELSGLERLSYGIEHGLDAPFRAL